MEKPGIQPLGRFYLGVSDGRTFPELDEINTYPIQNGDNGNSKELPGDYILKDVNGDGVVNDLDKTLYSGPQPV